MDRLPALKLQAEYRDYVWGGQRLRPQAPITAESWVVYEGDRVKGGSLDGRVLGQLAAEFESRLLGERVFQRSGKRFPLLIKLLDCAAWLSLQVHPNDQQALEMEGPEHFGKTEAWHILDADAGAQLVAGFLPGTDPAEALEAIRRAGKGDQRILDLVQFLTVRSGDTVLMRAGTLHALGPGLLVYEVQETSDLTYRVFDWNRPQVKGRILHSEKSLAVTKPEQVTQPLPLPMGVERATLTQCEYFTLEHLAPTRALALDTLGESFHALTIIEGGAQLLAGAETLTLERYESVLLPAEHGRYQLVPDPACRALLAYP